MGCYLAWKRFGVCLEQMFEHGHFIDLDDSYYLAKVYKEKISLSIGQIYRIYNHNCLNFLISHKRIMSSLPLTILRQNCRLNNISRPNHLYKLFERVEEFYPSQIIDIFNILFGKKFYDMIKILSKHKYFLIFWIVNFIKRHNIITSISDDAKQEIITLGNMDIVTPEKVYGMMETIILINMNISNTEKQYGTMEKCFYYNLKIEPKLLPFIKHTFNI
jgi:hypothetical protein